MRRTEARELLMQLLFQCEAQKDFSFPVKEGFILENDLDEESKAYFEKVWNAFISNRDAVDGMIEAYSNGWKKTRIGKVDLAVLRLCITEIRFLDDKDDIPENSSINEAVNLAKKFSDEKSGKFVNGILGRISRGEDPLSKENGKEA